MIRNIIFDLGNVLLSYQPMAYIRTKIPDEQTAQRVYRAMFLSEEWLMLDRGVITEEEAVGRVCSQNPQDCEAIRFVMEDWYRMLTPIEGSVDILKELSGKGYRNLILSNFQALAYEKVTGQYDFFQFFVGGVISYQEKLMKPEREIFELLIQRYELKPEESLFIDDSQDNIKAAESLGLKGILFIDSEDLRERLAQYGVVV